MKSRKTNEAYAKAVEELVREHFSEGSCNRIEDRNDEIDNAMKYLKECISLIDANILLKENVDAKKFKELAKSQIERLMKQCVSVSPTKTVS